MENKSDEEAEAKERQGTRNDLKDNVKDFVTTLSQGFSQDQDEEVLPGRVRSRLAQQAGVSEGTLSKVEKIIQSQNIPLIHECETGKKSVNAAFMELQQGNLMTINYFNRFAKEKIRRQEDL